MQQEQKSNPVADAMKVIADALKEDKSEGSYYYSWQANIAMAFMDEFGRQFDKLQDSFNSPNGYKNISKSDVHIVANNAAKNFLDLLCK